MDIKYKDARPMNWTGHNTCIPVSNRADYVSLGEGDTPIINLPHISNIVGGQISSKMEFMNPTGSFKDRGTAVMISALKNMDVSEIVEDSSGNAGASISAYSARAGIKAHIFAPATAPKPKLDQISVYGAETHLIKGTRDDSTKAAILYATSNSIPYASHNLSPFFIEGTKLFAHEIYRDLEEDLPEHIVVPVGNGSLFLGAWKGFSELKELNLVKHIPKLHCVQAESVMPIVSAFSGGKWGPDDVKPTIAGGIAVGSPPRLKQITNVLEMGKGTSIAVSENDIKEWQVILAKEEGIYLEPTSAAAFAGTKHLIDSGAIKNGASILIPITGFGLKDNPPKP
jgi:threonine synthase